jgi:hypothetical protein
VRLLEAAGFTDIKPLNVGFQHPGGDVLMRKNGRPFYFSVKTRDRFGQDGKPNPCYSIYPEKIPSSYCGVTILADGAFCVDVKNALHPLHGLQSLLHRLGRTLDNKKISSGRPFWLARTLFPMA